MEDPTWASETSATPEWAGEIVIGHSTCRVDIEHRDIGSRQTSKRCIRSSYELLEPSHSIWPQDLAFQVLGKNLWNFLYCASQPRSGRVASDSEAALEVNRIILNIAQPFFPSSEKEKK